MRGDPIPRSIFLLGPNRWDDDVHVPTPIWAQAALEEAPDSFTPKHLREAAAAILEDEDPTRQGVVMDPEAQEEGESDGEFFHRLEDEHDVDAYFVIVPMRTKVLGTVFEGGMLERDFHYGRNPTVLLFLEEGFARNEGDGAYTFIAKGKRTRYLESIAERAHHVHLWETLEGLIDAVLAWAFVDP